MIDDSNHVVIENGHEIKKNNELKDKEINTLKAKGLQNEIEKEVTLENVPKGVPEIEMNIEMENTQGIEQEKVEPQDKSQLIKTHNVIEGQEFQGKA